ncbi:MAG: hypothetical protein LBB68_06235 [Treponema sp.]|nr:hypothetical protein [Treponema sp.]
MLRLFFAVLLACCGLGTAQAQIFKPFTPLQVIRTERFDIIYPPESALTAQALAARADGIYDRISGLLGISLERRIPVSITPHIEAYNGYTKLYPYPHIVLYDTPMDIEQTTYENSLDGLFIHELTHAISLSARSPGYRRLYKIFGGWVTPSMLLTAPAFMVEGVTVSFESLNGFGRANDPLIEQHLRQDIYEGAFLTPFQAAGISRYPNNYSAYYEYGGLFSAWLQKTYGMAKYARLWRRMGGEEYHFSFFFYNNGYFNIFKNVYGMPFLDAWSAFKESLRIDTIEENPEEPVYEGLVPGPWFIPEKGAKIPAVAAGGGKVFFLDTIARAVLSYDPGSGRLRRTVPADSTAYGLDVSADGDRLLISSYRNSSALPRAVVTEYTSQGRKTGRVYRGLYGGRYFRDGVIGLSSDLHNNRLVFRLGGEEQVLLQGDEELLYGSPSALNETWIVFIAAKKGNRELCLYNFDTREVYTLESGLGDSVNSPDDEYRWRYIRSVQVTPGYLLFTYNHDRGMYKLALADISGIFGGALPDALEAVFTERDFSGGVSLPVVAGGSIFYRGGFSKWDALLRYPESPAALSGARLPLTLRPWPAEDLARAQALPRSRPTGPSGAPPLAIPDSPFGRFPPDSGVPPSKRYAGLSYMNPLKYWLPLPLLRSGADNSISVDGGGILSVMSDPTDTNYLVVSAYMDARSLMAAGSFSWVNYALGFPLELYAADDLDKTRDTVRRISQASLGGTITFGLGNERTHLDLIPKLSAGFMSEDPGDGSNPYTWDYDEYYYSAGLGLGISNLIRPSWALFGKGLSLGAYGRLMLDRPGLRQGFRVPRVEGVFNAAFEPLLPLRLRLYGAWDRDGMDLRGQSRYFLSTSFDPFASTEYPRQEKILLEWIAGGEAELKLFSLDIQKNLSHLYYNRLYGTLAYRGAVYDDQGYRDTAGRAAEGTPLGGSSEGTYRLAQSLVLRLGLAISTIIFPGIPLSITPGFWGAWKFPNMNDGNGSNDFSLGIGVSVSY